MKFLILSVHLLIAGFALAADTSRQLPLTSEVPLAAASTTQAKRQTGYVERYGGAAGGQYDSYGTHRPYGSSYSNLGGKSLFPSGFTKLKVIHKKPIAAPYVNAYRPVATYGTYRPAAYNNAGYGNSYNSYGYSNGYGSGAGYAKGAASYGTNYGSNYGYRPAYNNYNSYGYTSGYGSGYGYGSSGTTYGSNYGTSYGAAYGGYGNNYGTGYGYGSNYGSGYGSIRTPVTYNGFDHYNGPFYYGGWLPTLGPYGNALTPNNLNSYGFSF